MRVITRRRVKVRVTVKRSDGTTHCQTWQYHRKRSPEEQCQERPQQTPESSKDIAMTYEFSGSKDDNKSSEFTYRSFDDVFDTYEDNMEKKSIDINQCRERSMPDKLSLRNPPENLLESRKSSLLSTKECNVDVAMKDCVPRRSMLRRNDSNFQNTNHSLERNSILNYLNTEDFRSHSLPRDKTFLRESSPKYYDSELSASCDSVVEAIAKQPPMPSPRSFKEKKPSYFKSLESINEDPSENVYINKIPGNNLSKSLSEDLWKTNNKGNLIHPSRRRNYIETGAIPKRKLVTFELNPQNNRVKTIEYDAEEAIIPTFRGYDNLSNTTYHADNKLSVLKPAKDIDKFSCKSTHSNDIRQNASLNNTLSGTDETCRKPTELQSGLCDSCQLKESFSTAELLPMTTGLSDDAKFTRNTSFTVSCDDLRGLCKENKYIIEDPDYVGDSGKRGYSIFNEIITFDRFPGQSKSENTLHFDNDRIVHSDPNWLNERVSHSTMNGDLKTENVSTHVKSGTKIETTTSFKFCDKARDTDLRSGTCNRAENGSTGRSNSGDAGLLRASSETVITLRKGEELLHDSYLFNDIAMKFIDFHMKEFNLFNSYVSRLNCMCI